MNDDKGQSGSTLLCFAHKGEAQCFFQHFLFEPHPRFHDVWIKDNKLLLLTGEGIDGAMTKMGLILGAHPEIKQVFNLGVAGALRDDLKLHQIINIRSVYGEDRFHSYELKGDVDILTAQQRVLDSKHVPKLRAFAPAVDRELWGIARVCREAKVQLSALKIISDLVTSQPKEICTVVRENAVFYSEQLLEAYLATNSNEIAAHSTQAGHDSLFQNELFHFSKVQQRQTQKLAEQLKQTNFDLDSLIQSIGLMPRRPKDRARIFIEECQKRVFPLEYKVKEALLTYTKKDHERGIEVQFDSHLEDHELKVRIKASTPHQWSQSLKALESFQPERYWKILRGEIDV